MKFFLVLLSIALTKAFVDRGEVYEDLMVMVEKALLKWTPERLADGTFCFLPEYSPSAGRGQKKNRHSNSAFAIVAAEAVTEKIARITLACLSSRPEDLDKWFDDVAQVLRGENFLVSNVEFVPRR